MEGLDYLGAGEGLAAQAYVVRIRKIDPDRLAKAAQAGKWRAAINPALAVVDQFPALALSMAAPVIQDQLAGYGITADVTLADAPPPPSRRLGETKAALAVGLILGTIVTLGGHWVYNRLRGT